MRPRLFLLVLLSAVLAACTTSPTVAGPSGGASFDGPGGNPPADSTGDGGIGSGNGG